MNTLLQPKHHFDYKYCDTNLEISINYFTKELYILMCLFTIDSKGHFNANQFLKFNACKCTIYLHDFHIKLSTNVT